jgi:hypothetical protein
MPIIYEAQPVFDGAERVSTRQSAQAIRANERMRAAGGETVAQALEHIGGTVNGLIDALGRTVNGVFDEITVTDAATGAIIGWIGTNAATGAQGLWAKEGYFGGDSPANAPLQASSTGRVTLTLGDSDDQAYLAVLDSGGTPVVWMGKTGSDYGIWAENVWIGGTGPSDAPFFSDGTHVAIGENGYVVVLDADAVEVGFVGSDIDTAKAITAWGAHTTGERIITINAHGWVSGNTVKITGSGAGNGKWGVRKLSANTLLLLGSTVANAGAGGTAERYFAGVWGEQLAAAGSSPYEAYIKANAGGLFINDAHIEIEGQDSLGNTVVTTISPEEIEISNAAENQYLQLSEGYLLASTITGSQTAVEIWPGLSRVKRFIGPHYTEGALEMVQVGPNWGARLSLGDNSGTFLIQLDGPTGMGYMGGLELTNPLAVLYGGTGAANEADARTNLDVYSKAEVDAIIAALNFLTQADADLLYSPLGHGHTVTINAVGNHTHGGVVAGDGSHFHTGTVT